MELIKHLAQVHIDCNSHLDIKTNLPDGEVEVMIHPKLKSSVKYKYRDLSNFLGTIKFDLDGIEYQKRIRNE